MIRTIEKIKNLGVFDAYSWPSTSSDIKAFKRYNLLYGTNGSGKTTLCRLFGALNEGSHPDYPALEYRLSLEGGSTLSQSQKFATKLRVFDSDYVRRNIGDIDGELNPIIIIGEENLDLAKEIDEQESDIMRRESAIASTEPLLAREEKNRGSKFTEIAKTISVATSGQTTRTYRKNNAEDAYAKASASEMGFVTLDDETLEENQALIRQEIMAEVAEIEPLTFLLGLGTETKNLDDLLQEFREETNHLLQTTATARFIDKLKNDAELNEWVEKGFHLHISRSLVECEFCGNSLRPERLAELAAHFNEADQALKGDLEEQITICGALKSFVSAHRMPRADLYRELRGEADEVQAQFATAEQELIEAVHSAEALLRSKLKNRGNVFSGIGPILRSLAPLRERMAAIHQRHNSKSSSFAEQQGRARDAIELHYLASIHDQVEEIDERIRMLKAEIANQSDGAGDDKVSLVDLKENVRTNKAKIANTQTAADQLTERLHAFLGRQELKFTPDGQGYRVHRNGQQAFHLSEGERTAIAFVYFSVHLGDQDFDRSEGIIVVDDPISSLDSGAVYQAFSFLKHSVKDAKQVFLLTHNFEFLKLLVGWLKNEKVNVTAFYMLECSGLPSGGRASKILTLDKQLVNHVTEYNYLFKVLYEFQSDGTIAQSYPIPNMVRKVIETLLHFFYPDAKTEWERFRRIPFKSDPQEIKANALYKYCQELSHITGPFNPALVKATQTHVKYLFEMIEAIAPEHYRGMVASIE